MTGLEIIVVTLRPVLTILWFTTSKSVSFTCHKLQCNNLGTCQYIARKRQFGKRFVSNSLQQIL